MNKIDNTNISKVLGQRVSAPEQYDNSILVREPRQSNRTYLNIFDSSLPFCGKDLWNNWEVSLLTENGLPVTAIAQIIYDCSSKYIVESKSAKLYFNSFNMTRKGSSPIEALQWLRDTAIQDLSNLLETPVSVELFDPGTSVLENTGIINQYDSYQTLEKDFNINDITFNQYTEDSSLIKTFNHLNNYSSIYFKSTLLRSNCRVTNQPDHGDVYIYMKSNMTPTPESLLQYIVSFRNECHFHEEICEAIYKRLMDVCRPKELSVACYYVRRGSLDINPIRVSHEHLLENFYTNNKLRYPKTFRQ
jgi:7-cyano-7-deazaguanine reductase